MNEERVLALAGLFQACTLAQQLANDGRCDDGAMEASVASVFRIDAPSVVGWARWRELCQRHVFGLAEAMLAQGMAAGRIRNQPTRPLAHILMGASDEAALYVAEAADHAQARAEMIEVIDQLIEGITA